MHNSTFEYLNPSLEQKESMVKLRAAAKAYHDALNKEIIDGPDKTYIMRELRALAMWANVAITRHADGSPR